VKVAAVVDAGRPRLSAEKVVVIKSSSKKRRTGKHRH
jgi:hypothetical protein